MTFPWLFLAACQKDANCLLNISSLVSEPYLLLISLWLLSLTYHLAFPMVLGRDNQSVSGHLCRRWRRNRDRLALTRVYSSERRMLSLLGRSRWAVWMSGNRGLLSIIMACQGSLWNSPPPLVLSAPQMASPGHHLLCELQKISYPLCAPTEFAPI